jgi:hypothetical protein
MSAWQNYINRKIEAALMLGNGQCNGDYSDACVLLSALLSGIAAELWPGKDHIDGKRFVELWVRYGDPTLDPVLISVPFVRQHLRKLGRSDDVHAIDEARPQMFGLGHSSRILLGSDVDMNEAALLTITSLKASDIRRYSYPVLFYKHVRSNLAHEYKLSEDAVSHFLTRREANVSYNNRVDTSEAEMTRRLIHFHLEWIAKIVRSIASNVADLVDAYKTVPRPDPWWING